MKAPIERLPAELVDLIVTNFSLSDYQNVRLVSNQLFYLTLPSFCDRYFTRRNTSLASSSLDRLLKVATCRVLADSVLFLDVKLLNRADYESLQQISRVGIYPPPKRFPRIPQVRLDDISQEAQLFEYMRHTKDPKIVTDKLARALRRLPNLKTIRIRVNGTTVGGVPDQMFDDHEFLARSFRAIMGALYKSESKIQELYTTKGTTIYPSTKSVNLDSSAFLLPVYAGSSLAQSFCSLRTLSLSLCTEIVDSRMPGWEDNITRFINSATVLEKLTLCTLLTNELTQLKTAFTSSLARSVCLCKLNTLQLYGFHVDAADMRSLLGTHSRTLRHVTIRDCRLLEGTWASLIAFFQELNLEYLRLAQLRHKLVPKCIFWVTPVGGKKNRIILDIRGNPPAKSMDEMLAVAIETLVPSVPLLEIVDP